MISSGRRRLLFRSTMTTTSALSSSSSCTLWITQRQKLRTGRLITLLYIPYNKSQPALEALLQLRRAAHALLAAPIPFYRNANTKMDPQISYSFFLPRCAYTLSRYFLISAKPLFRANSILIGIFISICEQTLTSIPPATSTILVAVSTISPLTLFSCSGQLISLVVMLQCQLSLLKVCFTQQKSRAEIISIFLYDRYITRVFSPITSSSLRYWSMFESSCFWIQKSFDSDSQFQKSVGSLKKYTKTLFFPQGQQCSLSPYSLQGSERLLQGGSSKRVESLASLSLKRWQYGWDGLITFVQSLLISSAFRSFSSSSWDDSRCNENSLELRLGSVDSSQTLSLLGSEGSVDWFQRAEWASSSWEWATGMKLLFSSLGSQATGYFLMRQEHRQRSALSYTLYILLQDIQNTCVRILVYCILIRGRELGPFLDNRTITHNKSLYLPKELQLCKKALISAAVKCTHFRPKQQLSS